MKIEDKVSEVWYNPNLTSFEKQEIITELYRIDNLELFEEL